MLCPGIFEAEAVAPLFSTLVFPSDCEQAFVLFWWRGLGALMMLFSYAATGTTRACTPTSCAAPVVLFGIFFVCLLCCSRTDRRCFLLLFICSHATWVISQLVHSPPPFEASSILMLELPVLTCQSCSCKHCQILPYCVPCLPAAHTWSQGFL